MAHTPLFRRYGQRTGQLVRANFRRTLVLQQVGGGCAWQAGSGAHAWAMAARAAAHAPRMPGMPPPWRPLHLVLARRARPDLLPLPSPAPLPQRNKMSSIIRTFQVGPLAGWPAG